MAGVAYCRLRPVVAMVLVEVNIDESSMQGISGARWELC